MSVPSVSPSPTSFTPAYSFQTTLLLTGGLILAFTVLEVLKKQAKFYQTIRSGTLNEVEVLFHQGYPVEGSFPMRLIMGPPLFHSILVGSTQIAKYLIQEKWQMSMR